MIDELRLSGAVHLDTGASSETGAGILSFPVSLSVSAGASCSGVVNVRFLMAFRMAVLALGAVFSLLTLETPMAADDKEKAAAVTDEDGKYFDAEGNPTFKIESDGTVDWYTFSGYRRYHSDCHVCHGPDGVGSSYAPGLAESMKNLDYAGFLSIVAEGRKNVGGGKENVMPAFGENKNVYCYLDDIYVYLRARAVGAAPRGRPPKKADKPEAAKAFEASCMGG